jgi:hypothetical protein
MRAARKKPTPSTFLLLPSPLPRRKRDLRCFHSRRSRKRAKEEKALLVTRIDRRVRKGKLGFFVLRLVSTCGCGCGQGEREGRKKKRERVQLRGYGAVARGCTVRGENSNAGMSVQRDVEGANVYERRKGEKKKGGREKNEGEK